MSSLFNFTNLTRFMSKPFLRESSGLVKNATLKDLVMLNVANMGAGLAVFEGISPYIQPGSILWLTSLLTFILTLPLVYTYTSLLMRMPRTGGGLHMDLKEIKQ